MGLVEARRSAVYEAKGEYIFFFDSDDVLTPNCIKDLMSLAQKENYDIVQGSFVTFPEENKRKIANYQGLLKDKEIFRSWLIEKKSSSYLWAKLIRREILLEAFNCIPPVFCNVGEDFVIWFFVTRFAHTYYGIENIVYKYRQTSGMTSNKKIDNEEQIKMIDDYVIQHFHSQNIQCHIHTPSATQRRNTINNHIIITRKSIHTNLNIIFRISIRVNK